MIKEWFWLKINNINEKKFLIVGLQENRFSSYRFKLTSDLVYRLINAATEPEKANNKYRMFIVNLRSTAFLIRLLSERVTWL